MKEIRAIGFDLFNTLLYASPDAVHEAIERLTGSLMESGINLDLHTSGGDTSILFSEAVVVVVDSAVVVVVVMVMVVGLLSTVIVALSAALELEVSVTITLSIISLGVLLLPAV